MAAALCWGSIHRLWQMLLKGLQDVDVAPDPREAAEMALLRLIHAADLPDPAFAVARLSGEGMSAAPAAHGRADGRRRRLRGSPPIFRRWSSARERPASTCSPSSFTTRSGWSATRRPSWC